MRPCYRNPCQLSFSLAFTNLLERLAQRFGFRAILDRYFELTSRFGLGLGDFLFHFFFLDFPACFNAIAKACDLDFTFGPVLLPECKLWCLNSCITFSTLAFLPALVFGFFRAIALFVAPLAPVHYDTAAVTVA